MYKVKNLSGTGGRIPNSYSSWLAYWKAKTKRKATKCNHIDCNEKNNLVGAHVKQVGAGDDSWYIVPLCQSCNKRTDVFYVSGPLVAVNP